MNKKLFKKFISALLALTMIVSALPATLMASAASEYDVGYINENDRPIYNGKMLSFTSGARYGSSAEGIRPCYER